MSRRSMSASRRRSSPLAELCARGALGSGPERLRRTGRGAHLHLHAEMVRREPDDGAVERERVGWIRDDRNGDKADVTDAAAPAADIDPSDARQIALRPALRPPATTEAARTHPRA